MNTHQRKRYGETGGIPFRSSRFYSLGGEWFFAIRRGSDQGPFLTKNDAKKALIRFLHEQFAFERTRPAARTQASPAVDR
jgi:hypothetical protein